jgi:hypothetical protein
MLKPPPGTIKKLPNTEYQRISAATTGVLSVQNSISKRQEDSPDSLSRRSNRFIGGR